MRLNADHVAIRDQLVRFIDAEINPNVDDWEREGIFPAHALFRKLGQLGFLGIDKPGVFGGMELDLSFAVVMAEALGHIDCSAVPMAIGVHTDMATPALARFGSDALRTEFLAPSIAGERVACLGVSESGAGSDVASIRTVARRDGDDYVIDGGKMWITNATQADWMCLLATTGDGPTHSNKSLIVVPMYTPGVQVSPRLDKLGMRASDTAAVSLDGVRVPRRHRIGEEGHGFQYQMVQFQQERLWSAASVLLPMERQIRQTIDYTRQRIAFGRPILDNQVVHFRLAELQTEIEALRALIYRAVEEHLEGMDISLLASMAKLKAGRLARKVADNCLQYWGGMGFMNESPISRAYRDFRLVSIGAGADEVMLSIIAKQMGTLPGRR